MRSLLLCGCLLLAAPGCRRAVKLSPVGGRVYYRDQPLPGGTIVFTPDPQHGGRGPQAWAEIGPDGRYRLSTGPEPAPPPGWHRVTVAPGRPDALNLPGRYRDPELSGQCLEVVPDQPNTLDVHLE